MIEIIPYQTDKHIVKNMTRKINVINDKNIEETTESAKEMNKENIKFTIKTKL